MQLYSGAQSLKMGGHPVDCAPIFIPLLSVVLNVLEQQLATAQPEKKNNFSNTPFYIVE